MTAGPIGQGIGTIATVTGIVGTFVASIIGVLTWRTTHAGVRGNDWERLAGTLSTWSQTTIAELRTELAQAEAECLAKVAEAEARWESRVAEELARGNYWRARALGQGDPDDTPPPEAREGR